MHTFWFCKRHKVHTCAPPTGPGSGAPAGRGGSGGIGNWPVRREAAGPGAGAGTSASLRPWVNPWKEMGLDCGTRKSHQSTNHESLSTHRNYVKAAFGVL